MYEIRKYGGNGVLVEFETNITPEIHDKVLRLAALVQKEKGVVTVIPAYQSLTVLFDETVTTFENVKQSLSKIPENEIRLEGRRWNIPICYDDTFALDKKEVMHQTGMSWQEIVNLHTSTSYRVYLLGFQPGFAYLGTLPKELRVKRKATPRKDVPAQHVGLAGLQTGIYPATLPGGWQIIGSTPLPAFFGETSEPLLKVGDEVTFHSISQATYKNIKAEPFKQEKYVVG